MQHVPRILMETYLREPKYPQKSSKTWIFLILFRIFLLTTVILDIYLYNQYDIFLKKNIFHEMVPLKPYLTYQLYRVIAVLIHKKKNNNASFYEVETDFC